MRNRIWWLTLLRGVLTAILGLLLLFWPDKSADAVIMFVGAFALITGLIATIHAATAKYSLWGTSIFGGLVTIALGLIAFFWPDLTATILVYIVAIWALVVGMIEIVGGLAIGAGSSAGALTTGLGLVSVVLAMLLFMVPEAGIIAAAWLIGAYFLAHGGLTAYHAIEVRRSSRRVEVM